ncbi:MFS transporter [Streptomyces sp. TR06-5]|uniref:MFS transporter n=1 Tax=unclassified Streptomyces TaxID=2593676 RepID=UPI0039A11319
MPATPQGPPVKARAAVAALFFTNGFVFSNVVPRYPEIKADLALSNAALGTAIAAMPLGALLVGLAAGPLIARFGSAWTAVVSQVLMGVDVVLVGTAPSYTLLWAAVFTAGSLDAVTDVAMNAHGMRVQRRYGRSILNSFHGVWSIGAVLGGLAGAAAAGAGVPLPVHLCGAGVFAAVSATAGRRFLLPGPEDAERDPASSGGAPGDASEAGRVRFRRPVVTAFAVLGLLTAAAAVVEDSPASWGATYLQNELGTGAFVGGFAFIALQGTQTVGRLLGDRVVHRTGERTTARLGGLLVAFGMGTALTWPTVPTTVAGFALAGFGIATLIPAAFRAADEVPGLPPGTGITVAAFLLRLGFLASPPVIGIVADATSIRTGLVLVPAAGAVILLTSGILGGARGSSPAAESHGDAADGAPSGGTARPASRPVAARDES